MNKSRFWETFVELFRQSVIIQGGVTLLMMVTICVMLMMMREIPKEMWALTGIVLGYWFGTKKDAAQARDIQTLAESVRAAAATSTSPGCSCADT